MNIYKTVFDTEQQGKDVLIQKDVWQEVTEEGVTSMQYINGTKAVVNIGKVICLLYTSPSPRDRQKSRMPSSA